MIVQNKFSFAEDDTGGCVQLPLILIYPSIILYIHLLKKKLIGDARGHYNPHILHFHWLPD